ncbi:hypothetical protein MARINOS108_10579 [Marinoscillum sp. 108]|nr:hypothetical protein MARINOS108_10579 [Marinoscillum sp. 108]
MGHYQMAFLVDPGTVELGHYLSGFKGAGGVAWTLKTIRQSICK